MGVAEVVKRNKVSCGPLFRELQQDLCESFVTTYDSLDSIKLGFAAGFAVGQAEKVYLGACSAAMFRPSKEDHTWLLEMVSRISTVFDLAVTSWENEIWIHRVEHPVRFMIYKENSIMWHKSRGLACGVPYGEIDYDFHERQGAQDNR